MNSSVGRLLKNYSNTKQSWEAWCYMVNYNCKVRNFSVVRYIDGHELLFYLRFLSLKDFHIEAYKVLKKAKKGEDDIFRLLEKTGEINPKKSKMVESILIDLNKHSATIEMICNTRDKFYAHLDKDYKSYIYPKFELVKIEECLHLVEKAITVITSVKTLNAVLANVPSRNILSINTSR